MLEQLRTFFDIEKWQLDHLFDLGFQAWFVHVGVVTGTTGVLVVVYPDATWPWVWGGTMVCLSLILSALAHTYVRYPPASDSLARRFGVAHTVLTGLVGLTWGAGAFGVATGEFQNLLIYSLALGGTALGAASSQHVLPRSCFVSLWTSVPLLGLAHLFHNPGLFGATIMSMVMLYAGILSILTARMLRFMRANITLARSLDAKVGELTVMAAELDKARAEAVDASFSKSRFLAHASHDLRQPVHAIGLFTACLRDLDLGLEAAGLVESVDNAARSVSRLLGSLLDISRLDVGGIVPQPEAVDLDDLFQGILKQNFNAIQESGCTVSAPPCGLRVEADVSLLSTMIQNVLSNALKYAPGSRVEIEAWRERGFIVIEVQDAGPGIGEADLKHIFDEFYRASVPATRASEGLGLGLAIVRRLGALMDLDIDLVSQVGEGTRLSITGLKPAAPSMAITTRVRRLHPLNGLTVCLIDDDAEVLSASAMLMRRWGCEVVALSQVPDEPVGCDAIISDFDLGTEYDGIEAIRTIREIEGWNVPAAILSGRSEPETLKRLGRAGVPFMRKPVRPAELRALLTGFALDTDGPDGEEVVGQP